MQWAGLLWHLLEPGVRRKVAPYLTNSELQELNRGYRSYRRLSAHEKADIETAVAARTHLKRSSWPMICSMVGMILTGFLFIAHLITQPDIADTTRLALFQAPILGSLAPLTLYLLPPYRLRILFQPRASLETIIVMFFCTLGLIWTLVYIGFEDVLPAQSSRLDRFSFAILFLGAISAPLLEEIVFREFIPTLLGPAPHYAGHLLAIILFAIAHLPSTYTMFGLYLLAAGFLAVIRIQSETLFYCLLSHAIANGGILLLDL
ncbi:MAG: CPBP family intramembrane metalloprotease [Leptospiraceae bacterium]|nr:CPBP family intramembrane metalloprotease [Leptospiraceae bacterium]